MDRILMTPRDEWRQRCEDVGFTFYDLPSEDGRPYWNESAAYGVTPEEVDIIERVTQDLVFRTFDAAEHIVRERRFKEFAIPEPFWGAVQESWDIDDPTVYGRFDLAWDGTGEPQMLEYNADTPTSLIESSVVQWFWLKEKMGEDADQFNSIHERLIEQWKHIRTERWHLPEGSRLHLASLHDAGDDELIIEDFDTVAYMAEPAQQAGFDTKHVFIEDIGWNEEKQIFVDQDGEPIEHIFKLYPLEWMANEEFADKLLASRAKTEWVEPLWKMLLSNKQLLVVMHELFPNHPNILEAHTSAKPFNGRPYIRKPKLSREGANVELYGPDGRLIEAGSGDYGEEGHIFQSVANLGRFGTKFAVIGSWVVGQEPAGIDFRETSTLITGDLAEIVPHFIKR